ncbi:hypothetical protein ACM26W_00385 [Halomonas sp. HK25]|uniref:hypothetical protein n=1 Tax=Halomonas sp. HK25 TaxID=3394321 RepID=UPI0039FBEB0D
MLAAAIRAGAQQIVSFNLKDFPADTQGSFGAEVINPDTFLEQQFEPNEGLALSTAHRHRASLAKRPGFSEGQPEYYSASSCPGPASAPGSRRHAAPAR